MTRLAALLLAVSLLVALAASRAAGEAGRLSALLGSELVATRGVALGSISDLAFDARNGALLAVVSGGLAYPVSALQPRPRGGRYVLQAPFETRRFVEPRWPTMRASALMEREVVDRLHRDFGEIRDLLIDLEARRVRAAIVDRRDDWAPGRALMTVDIESLSLPRDLAEKVALNYSRERYE